MKKVLVGTGLFLGGVTVGAVAGLKVFKMAAFKMLSDDEYCKEKVYPRFEQIFRKHLGDDKVDKIIEVLKEKEEENETC